MKQLKELILSDENVNKDIKESTRNVKNFKEVVKEMEKIIKSNKHKHEQSKDGRSVRIKQIFDGF